MLQRSGDFSTNMGLVREREWMICPLIAAEAVAVKLAIGTEGGTSDRISAKRPYLVLKAATFFEC